MARGACSGRSYGFLRGDEILMNTITKTGVLLIVAHLLITLAIIGGYLITYWHTGHPDETFKFGIATILGYWFGAIGYDKLKSKGDKPNE